MALLNRDAILKKQDFSTRDVEVPEWGGTVRIRTMTVAERNEFVKRVSDGNTNVAAWLVSLVAIDEHGKQMFSQEDVSELEKKNFRAVDSVAKAILEVNQVSQEKIEDAQKNS